MNKTININLGGIFFHIDEVAYQKLKNYLNAIRRSLSDDPKGKDEIISDIELRIGELLSEKIKDVRQVVNENDIEEVIEVMGKPEDYMVDEDVFNDDSYTYKRTKSRKLYRDGSDKFFGGVSSGLSHYLNIDVIWIRLGWLIAAFGFGFGFIVYIILWILLPEANTTSEKLEMEGEEVNISNIEKKIKDELSNASEKIKTEFANASDTIKTGIDDVSEKIKSADYKKYKNKAKSGSQDIVETLGRVFTTLFMVIGKFIGVILLIISVSTILALLISLITAGSIDFFHEDWFYNNFNAMNNSGLPIWGVSVLIFILVGIPFIFLFFLGIRILSNNKTTFGRVTKMSLLGVWLVALLCLIFFGTKQLVESAYDGTVIEKQNIDYIVGDTLHIKMLDDEILSGNSNLWRNSGAKLVFDSNDAEILYSTDVRLSIYRADKEEFYLKLRKRSEGSSRISARDNARKINYSFKKNDNFLLLNGYYLAEKEGEYRTESINIDLYIPENQIIYIEESTKTFLNNVDNIQDVYDRDMPNHYYKMTKRGLDCLDCEEEEEEENDESKSFKMKIDKDGLNIKVKSDDNGKAEVIIDKEGVKIVSSRDSI